MSDSPNPLFALEKEYPFFAQTPLRRRIAAKLDHLLGLAGMSDMLASIPPGHRNPYQSSREYIEAEIEDRTEFNKLIPQSGPTIVVANHPFGALDAIVASELALTARPDTLVFGNAVLSHPAQNEWFLPLEILDDSPASRQVNLQSMKRALLHLRKGGCIVIFPAGEVERWRWSQLSIQEGVWTTHLARLVLKSGASILPLGFPGENPLWFHLPGAIHPTLRLLALPHAFLSRRGETVPVKVGPPISISNLPKNPDELTAAVRDQVLKLANRID